MNSQANINEIYKKTKKGKKYVIKLFGRWRHQSQFTTTETLNNHVRQQKAMNENASHEHTTSKMRNNIL